eukprot:9232004-Alexandrium_andersonii.AAC.1
MLPASKIGHHILPHRARMIRQRSILIHPWLPAVDVNADEVIETSDLERDVPDGQSANEVG